MRDRARTHVLGSGLGFGQTRSMKSRSSRLTATGSRPLGHMTWIPLNMTRSQPSAWASRSLHCVLMMRSPGAVDHQTGSR